MIGCVTSNYIWHYIQHAQCLTVKITSYSRNMSRLQLQTEVASEVSVAEWSRALAFTVAPPMAWV